LEFLKKNWIALLVLALVTYLVGIDKWENHQRQKTRSASASLSMLTDKESHTMLSSGMSVECLLESRKSDWATIEKKIQQDQQRLAAQGVLTPIAPTTSPLGARERDVLSGRRPAREFPAPTVDILAQLGVTIENQFEDRWGMTDTAIRGMADQAYVKNGIMDETLRGWTFSVRPSGNGSNTLLDVERKVAIVNLQQGDELFSGPHELAHVLSGPAFINDEDIPHVAKEFVAIAAEVTDPSTLRDTWTFSLQNIPILGMGRTINGESGVIHAQNAPLDGWRYDLLRLTDEVISEDGQVALAQNLWKEARNNGSLTMPQIKAQFEAAGIQDLAIFQETIQPGLYLDVTFTKTGTPVILAKTIDNDGYEGLTQVPEQIIWRDQDGNAIANGDPMPLQPAIFMDGAEDLAAYASALEVRVAGEVYTFRFPSTANVSDTTKKVVPSITKIH